MVGEEVVHVRQSVEPPPPPAPTVVLVHGVGVSSRNMEPTGRQLARACRVHIPDLPGFGKSSNPARVLDTAGLADAVVAWMDVAGLPSAAFLGNSFGCQLIVELAVRHPERVERVVLQGPTVDPKARGLVRQTWRWARNGLRERSTQSDVTFQDWRDAGFARVVLTSRYSLRHPIEDRLPHVTAPALVVRGSRDPIVTQDWAERATEMLPDGRLAVVPGAAHTITFNHPAELADVAIPFLQEGADARSEAS